MENIYPTTAEPLPRALIINDDAQQRERIARAIEGLCDVDTPTTHEELLRDLRSDPQRYAVVILDYAFEFWQPQQMPWNGGDVMAMLRATNAHTPHVLLLTNYETLPEVRKLAKTYHLPVAKVGNMSALEIRTAVKVYLRRAGVSS